MQGRYSVLFPCTGNPSCSIMAVAGEISLKAGDKIAAAHYLREIADLNSLGSEQAKTTLTSLSPVAVQR